MIASVLSGLLLIIAGGGMLSSDSVLISSLLYAAGFTLLFVDGAFVAFAGLILLGTLSYAPMTGMPALAFVLGAISFILFVATYMARAENWYEKLLLTAVWTGFTAGGMSIWLESPGQGIAIFSIPLVVLCILGGHLGVRKAE